MSMGLYGLLGISSGLIAALAFIPYIDSIIKHKAKPHPVTWIVWTITGFVALLTYWGVGARETIWIAVVNFLSSFIIAILSIRYWKERFSYFDYVCFILSIISIFIWLILESPTLALSLSLLADFIAALPTIKKVYHRPHTEHAGTWLILALATLVSIFAVEVWTYGVLLLPVYLFCLSLFIAALSLRKKPVHRKTH